MSTDADPEAGRPSSVGDRDAPCPCGSGAAYGACCRPWHLGAPAPDPERVMRSRYSAWVLAQHDHLLRTWHPRTRPPQVRPVPGLRWTGLEVRASTGGGPGESSGTVTFAASYVGADGPGVLAETSRFERRGGRWLYLDDAEASPEVPDRPTEGER